MEISSLSLVLPSVRLSTSVCWVGSDLRSWMSHTGFLLPGGSWCRHVTVMSQGRVAGVRTEPGLAGWRGVREEPALNRGAGFVRDESGGNAVTGSPPPPGVSTHIPCPEIRFRPRQSRTASHPGAVLASERRSLHKVGAARGAGAGGGAGELAAHRGPRKSTGIQSGAREVSEVTVETREGGGSHVGWGG